MQVECGVKEMTCRWSEQGCIISLSIGVVPEVAVASCRMFIGTAAVESLGDQLMSARCSV